GIPCLLGMGLVLWLSAVPGWAGFDEGVHAYCRGDPATALRELLPLARQGHTRAQSFLGDIYHFGGRGVPQDYGQAAYWYRRAAAQGDVTAQGWLGFMYRVGWGVPQDVTQAVQWLRRAAEQGDTGAQFNLGGCYLYGDGVSQDYGQALQWIRR